MNEHSERPASSLMRDPVWMVALALTMGAAIAVRAWMNFRTPIPGGVDAGYYAVQARALLEHGKLAWTDVPLIFALDAALAKLAMLTLGWSVDDATLWASRLVDSVGQPLVAVSLFVATFMWSRGLRSAVPAAVAATLVTTVSSPILRMVGDFEKQSLAMAFMAAAWLGLARTMAATDARQLRIRAAWTMAFFVLTALTHAGTFGAAALGAVFTLTAWAVWSGVSRGRRLPDMAPEMAPEMARGTLIAGASGAALLGAIWMLAPLKAQALIDAPRKLFGGGGGGDGGGGPGPNGPPLILWLLAVAICATALVWALRRARATIADGALALGLAATAASLTCPLIHGEYAMRLSIIAPLPLAFVMAFVLAREPTARRGWRAPVASVALGIAALATNAIGGRGGPPLSSPQMISTEGFAELRGWRDELAARGTTVVVARHGLEFWAAFALDCDARQSQLKDSDFDLYQHPYLLYERHDGSRHDGSRSDRPPGGPPGDFAPDRPQRRPPPMGDPMSAPQLPASARVFMQGKHFTLYEAPATDGAESARRGGSDLRQ
ncbi:MAG: hypothetical protein WCI96_06685 [Planctomycetota bacterium]